MKFLVEIIYLNKCKKKKKTLPNVKLTGISVVEVVLNVTADVVVFLHLGPVTVRLLVVANENPKKYNHGDLPHKADGRQTDTHVGVLVPAEEIPKVLTAVPHDCGVG